MALKRKAVYENSIERTREKRMKWWCKEAFEVVFDFSAAAVLPPPAPVLYDLDLELVLVLFKQRSESELRFNTVQVEIDLQRAPQTLPATELGQVEWVYRDKSELRSVTAVIEEKLSHSLEMYVHLRRTGTSAGRRLWDSFLCRKAMF